MNDPIADAMRSSSRLVAFLRDASRGLLSKEWARAHGPEKK